MISQKFISKLTKPQTTIFKKIVVIILSHMTLLTIYWLSKHTNHYTRKTLATFILKETVTQVFSSEFC